MLTVVEVTNPGGATLRLVPDDTENGYSVREITGLDPVTAVLTSSSLAQVDGAQPQNARRDIRNITMKLGFEPDYVDTTVASLRAVLYDFFMSKALVDIGFYIDDILFAVISGQVEDFQAPMFVSDPEADISIVCYDPDFMAPEAVVISTATVTDSTTAEIDYAGSSDCGVIFELSIDTSVGAIQLQNTTPAGNVQTFTVTYPFIADDVVTINTIPLQKSIKLLRAGFETSLLSAYDSHSDWIALQRGANFFRATASGETEDYTLTYTPRYGGL